MAADGSKVLAQVTTASDHKDITSSASPPLSLDVAPATPDAEPRPSTRPAAIVDDDPEFQKEILQRLILYFLTQELTEENYSLLLLFISTDKPSNEVEDGIFHLNLKAEIQSALIIFFKYDFLNLEYFEVLRIKKNKSPSEFKGEDETEDEVEGKPNPKLIKEIKYKQLQYLIKQLQILIEKESIDQNFLLQPDPPTFKITAKRRKQEVSNIGPWLKQQFNLSENRDLCSFDLSLNDQTALSELVSAVRKPLYDNHLNYTDSKDLTLADRQRPIRKHCLAEFRGHFASHIKLLLDASNALAFRDDCDIIFKSLDEMGLELAKATDKFTVSMVERKQDRKSFLESMPSPTVAKQAQTILSTKSQNYHTLSEEKKHSQAEASSDSVASRSRSITDFSSPSDEQANAARRLSLQLVNHRFDIDAQNEHGDTTLHLLVKKFKPEAKEKFFSLLALALKRHPQLDIPNKEGKTPLEVCDEQGNTLAHLAAEANLTRELFGLLPKAKRAIAASESALSFREMDPAPERKFDDSENSFSQAKIQQLLLVKNYKGTTALETMLIALISAKHEFALVRERPLNIYRRLQEVEIYLLRKLNTSDDQRLSEQLLKLRAAKQALIAASDQNECKKILSSLEEEKIFDPDERCCFSICNSKIKTATLLAQARESWQMPTVEKKLQTSASDTLSNIIKAQSLTKLRELIDEGDPTKLNLFASLPSKEAQVTILYKLQDDTARYIAGRSEIILLYQNRIDVKEIDYIFYNIYQYLYCKLPNYVEGTDDYDNLEKKVLAVDQARAYVLTGEKKLKKALKDLASDERIIKPRNFWSSMTETKDLVEQALIRADGNDPYQLQWNNFARAFLNF